MHVGLKGTMNALFLKDLALKTHRVRIPTKPAMHSNLKPATDSEPKPAGVPI